MRLTVVGAASVSDWPRPRVVAQAPRQIQIFAGVLDSAGAPANRWTSATST